MYKVQWYMLKPLANTKSCRKIHVCARHSAAIFRNVKKSALKCWKRNKYRGFSGIGTHIHLRYARHIFFCFLCMWVLIPVKLLYQFPFQDFTENWWKMHKLILKIPAGPLCGSLYLVENSITEVILAKIEQHSWDSPNRTLSSAIRKNRLIIFTGDEKQNGPVKTRVTCQCMVKRPFSPDEMQPDRYMPMPSVHYGQNSIFGAKIMKRFCGNQIQILEMFTQVTT